MKKTISVLFSFALMLFLSSCSGNGDITDDFYKEFPTGDEIVSVDIEKNPQAVIKLTDGSEITVELRYDVAPNAVADFIALAEEGIYETMGFTEIRNDCILMTDGMESEFISPYYVKDEIQSGSDKLSHVRGTVSMIRTDSSDTLTGRFFILTEDQEHFDNYFTAFGTVTDGIENLDKIASSETDEEGLLAEPVGIEKVKINTFGAEIPDPTIILK